MKAIVMLLAIEDDEEVIKSLLSNAYAVFWYYLKYLYNVVPVIVVSSADGAPITILFSHTLYQKVLPAINFIKYLFGLISVDFVGEAPTNLLAQKLPATVVEYVSGLHTHLNNILNVKYGGFLISISLFGSMVAAGGLAISLGVFEREDKRANGRWFLEGEKIGVHFNQLTGPEQKQRVKTVDRDYMEVTT